MSNAFITWKMCGLRFIAIPFGGAGDVSIIDEEGKGYGSWHSVASFKSRKEKDRRPIGKYRLSSSFIENLPFTINEV